MLGCFGVEVSFSIWDFYIDIIMSLTSQGLGLYCRVFSWGLRFSGTHAVLFLGEAHDNSGTLSHGAIIGSGQPHAVGCPQGQPAEALKHRKEVQTETTEL